MGKPVINIRHLGAIQHSAVIRGEGDIQGHLIATAFTDVASAVGTVAQALSNNPSGSPNTAPSVAAVQAQHVGAGVIEVAITHNGAQSGTVYHAEIANNQGFNNTRYFMGTSSRNGQITVPNGVYYVKTYSQYPFGGPASKPVVTGPIQVSGSGVTALLPSQGSGSGKPGQTGVGSGWG